MSSPDPPTSIPPSPTTSSAPPPLQIFTSIRYDPLLATHPVNNLFKGPNPFYMLSHHRDRLLAAAEHFKWPQACSVLSSDAGLKSLHQTLTQAVHDATTTATADSPPTHDPDPSPNPNPSPLRIRILISPTGTITTSTSPTPAVTLTQLFPTTLYPPTPPPPPTHPPLQPYLILLDTSPTAPTPHTSHKTTHRAPYTEARSRARIPSLAAPVEVLLYNPAGEITEGSLTSVYFWRGGRWVTPAGGCGGNRGTTRRWALEGGLCVEGCVGVESLRGGEGVWVSNGVRGFVGGVVRLGEGEGGGGGEGR